MPRGEAVLKSPPARIDIKFLEQYPEFIEFRTPKSEPAEHAAPAVADGGESDTPEEAFETAHQKM